MGRVFDAIAPVLPTQADVTDAGSTKGDVAQLMRAHLPEHLAYCVPAHPVAGSDRSGARRRRSMGCSEQRRVVLTRWRPPCPRRPRRWASGGRPAVRGCSACAPTSTTRCSPASVICRICWRLPMSRWWPIKPTRARCFDLPPPALKTSPALPAATRRCGATSAWPTATRYYRFCAPYQPAGAADAMGGGRDKRGAGADVSSMPVRRGAVGQRFPGRLSAPSWRRCTALPLSAPHAWQEHFAGFCERRQATCTSLCYWQ